MFVEKDDSFEEVYYKIKKVENQSDSSSHDS